MALPAPEAGGAMALSATAGKVVLADRSSAVTGASAAGVLDLVGYGAGAAAFEGAGPALAPSNAMALLRAGNGCVDSDDNQADFAAAAPAPRNGSTPFNLCTAGNAPIVAECPERFTTPAGSSAATRLSASDADGIVKGASVISGATAGIDLAAAGAIPAIGGSASFTLCTALTE